MEQHDERLDSDLAHALRRLKDGAVVPPVNPAREAALLAAFDAEQVSWLPPSGQIARSAAGAPSESHRRDYWYLSAFAAAAGVLLAIGIASAPAVRHAPPPDAAIAHRPPASPRDVRLEPPNEFVIVPGADRLPRMESGTLVRMDVPVSMLPSLGVTPPAGRATVVKADLIVGQDGLPRAVRLVN